MKKQPKSARQTYIDAHYDDYFAAQRKHLRRMQAFDSIVGLVCLAIVCTVLYFAVNYFGK